MKVNEGQIIDSQSSLRMQTKQGESFEKTKCLSGHEAQFVCVDDKCLKRNPFVCLQKQCKSFQEHEQCNYKRLKHFIEKITKKINPAAEIENKISLIFEQLVDELSDTRDKIIKEIQEGKTKDLFTQITIDKILNQEKVSSVGLTGATMYKLFNNQYQKQNSQKLKRILQEIQKEGQIFKTQQLTKFIQTIKRKFFTFTQIFKWSTQLIAQNITINNKTLSITRNSAGLNLCLIFSNCLGIGICMREHLRKTKFMCEDFRTTDHGCYLLCQDKSLWIHKDKNENGELKGISYQIGDVVCLNLNTLSWKLTFKNEKTLAQCSISVIPGQQLNRDQYNICVGVYTTKDQAELLDIEGDGKKQEIQDVLHNQKLLKELNKPRNSIFADNTTFNNQAYGLGRQPTHLFSD